MLSGKGLVPGNNHSCEQTKPGCDHLCALFLEALLHSRPHQPQYTHKQTKHEAWYMANNYYLVGLCYCLFFFFFGNTYIRACTHTHITSDHLWWSHTHFLDLPPASLAAQTCG